MSGVIFYAVVLNYRHWEVMSESGKVLDIIVLGKCELNFTHKKHYSFCSIKLWSIKRTN